MKTKKQIDLYVVNGSLEIATEREVGTTVSFAVSPGNMFGVIYNTAETRRFFRTALRRMEVEAAKRRAK